MTLRRVVLSGVLPALFVLLLVLGLWGAVEAARAVGAARDTRADANALQQSLRAGSWDAAGQRAGRLATDVNRLEGALSSPPLRLAGVLPVVGRDVRASREVALALQDASRGAQPLVAAARGLSLSSLLTDGRIDVDRLRSLAPAAAAADRGLTSAQRRVAAIDASTLHQPLRRNVLDLQRRLADLQARGATALLAARRLPALLGANGRRTYLVAVQNPAEARPTGGVLSMVGVLAADDGRLELLGTAGAPLGRPAAAAMADADGTPDFPALARRVDRLWRGTALGAPDGVLSADPLALQAVVRSTGALPVGDGPRLTKDNTAALLMGGAFQGDAAARDAFLARAASAVLTRISTPGAGAGAMWTALSPPAVRRHVMAWTRDSGDNALLRRLGVSGELPAPDAASAGVYVTSADGSRLDVYLRRALTVSASCGTQGPRLSLRLRNTAPADVPAQSGSRLPGARPTDHTVTVAWYLPPQRDLRALTVDGRRVAAATGTDRGWTTARTTVTVPRGTAVEVDAELSGAGGVTTVLDQPAVTPLRRVDVPCGR